MELHKQVVSLEKAKKLKELGFKQESLFMWAPDKQGFAMEVRLKRKISFERSEFVYSAYTVAELGEMLPDGYSSWRSPYGTKGWECESGDEKTEAFGETEADARAAMLIYLAENGLIASEK